MAVGLIETAATPGTFAGPYFGQGLLPCLLPKDAEVAEQNALRWGVRTTAQMQLLIDLARTWART